jgi:hypothetical protein
MPTCIVCLFVMMSVHNPGAGVSNTGAGSALHARADVHAVYVLHPRRGFGFYQKPKTQILYLQDAAPNDRTGPNLLHSPSDNRHHDRLYCLQCTRGLPPPPNSPTRGDVVGCEFIPFLSPPVLPSLSPNPRPFLPLHKPDTKPSFPRTSAPPPALTWESHLRRPCRGLVCKCRSIQQPHVPKQNLNSHQRQDGERIDRRPLTHPPPLLPPCPRPPLPPRRHRPVTPSSTSPKIITLGDSTTQTPAQPE